jgi:two-component system, OmpR family, sensor histidine kinase QseC
MKSIRAFLVIALLSTITLITFLAALNGYRDSLKKAEQLFDSELTDRAYLLSSTFTYAITNEFNQAQVLNSFTTQNNKNKHDIDSVFAFQIWQQNNLLLRSMNAPDIPIAQFEAGFQDRNIASHRWRTFSFNNKASNLWIMTAERMDIRYILAENIILETILPVVFMLPVIGLLIWSIISYGLYPLKQLAKALSNKRADDLSPFSVDKQPSELIQVVSSINDLFHRLETSFLREKRFASDAAHELRTPISAIKIHLHNLTHSGSEDKTEAVSTDNKNHSLQQLKSSVERMEHLIEQILNLNRISPEQYMSKFKTLDLYLLAQAIIAREYDQFNQKKQQIELQGEHCQINGDSFSLDVLLQNLLSNACKYTPEGGSILVSVTCSRSRNSNTRKKDEIEQVLLQVQNTGPGIPEELYERLFDRFYRLNGDRHNSGSTGCGLGLAIVKQITELHKATIVIDEAQFINKAHQKGVMISIFFNHSSSLATNLAPKSAIKKTSKRAHNA